MWIKCPLETLTYAGGKSFNVHNVDPNRLVVASLFQLVINELGDGSCKPTRVWYKEENTPMPSCIKPLHTAKHLRDMFENMRDNSTNWGTVYFQERDKIMLDSEHCLYSLPHPLCEHDQFEGLENLHQHAKLIDEVLNVLSLKQLASIYSDRAMMFVSRED